MKTLLVLVTVLLLSSNADAGVFKRLFSRRPMTTTTTTTSFKSSQVKSNFSKAGYDCNEFGCTKIKTATQSTPKLMPAPTKSK